MTRNTPEILVDFNRLDDDDVLWAPRSAAPDIALHDAVILVDRDENRCMGVVKSMDPRRLYIAAAVSTWQDANPVDVYLDSSLLIGALRGQVRAAAKAMAFGLRDEETFGYMVDDVNVKIEA